MKLQVLNCTGVPLRRATEGSAGIDLRAGTSVTETTDVYYFDTGIHVAIPAGYVGLVVARSSLHRKGWYLANSMGVIDSDYRGPIILALRRVNTFEYLQNYDLVAQLLIVPTPTIEIEEVNSLDSTARGTGGFGSTDNNKGEPKGGVEL